MHHGTIALGTVPHATSTHACSPCMQPCRTCDVLHERNKLDLKEMDLMRWTLVQMAFLGRAETLGWLDLGRSTLG
uniref:Uncharacterized protein n=1 Tax=Cannabis sativa TaxID=3483 RepID=A0A803PVC1_CANSA